MVISRKRSPNQPVTPLTVDNLPIEQVQSYRYLGVWLTSTLTWSVQVESGCQRARRQIGIIYRKFYGHSNRSTLLQLYLAYVQPHLEYAVPVWDPHQQGHINSLEKVQKFALKVCTGKWNMDYDSLLNFCKLSTLVSRRHYLKLSFLYQVCHENFGPGIKMARGAIFCNQKRPPPPQNIFCCNKRAGRTKSGPYNAEVRRQDSECVFCA